MSRSAVMGIGVAAIAAVSAGAFWLARHDAPPSAAEQWPLFGAVLQRLSQPRRLHGRDCVRSHVGRSIAHEPEIFETAVRKLRGAQMPPPGAPQPDNADPTRPGSQGSR